MRFASLNLKKKNDCFQYKKKCLIFFHIDIIKKAFLKLKEILFCSNELELENNFLRNLFVNYDINKRNIAEMLSKMK